MRKINPFETCPVYETEKLIFTKIKLEDAIDLFEVYSDLVTRHHMNNDNCGGEWQCNTIEIIEQGIKSWEQEYLDKFYIRWTVTLKSINKAIGTIELAPVPNISRFFDGNCNTGILRVDIKSNFETEDIFTEIYSMVKNQMFSDFQIKKIITKCNVEEEQRVFGLKRCKFQKLEDYKIIPYKNYYITKR